jgi:hypothetical protein
MPIPSERKNQVTRTRENNDPAAFSSKPQLDEHEQLHARKDDHDTRGMREDRTNRLISTEHKGSSSRKTDPKFIPSDK